MAKTSWLALPLAAVLLAPSVVLARQSPTLGELALREQERRRALKVSGKVLTNQDLPRAAPRPPAEAAASGQPDARAAKVEEVAKPEKVDEPVRDEAWWKQRVMQLREELRRNDMFAEALQTRINSLTNDFTGRDDPYQRARIAEDRAKALLEMDRVKADVEQTRQRIADIEEEARKAGVPAGWLR